jgi:hypothetical protein
MWPHFPVGLAHLVEGLIERIISEERIHFNGMTGAHAAAAFPGTNSEFKQTMG